MHKDEFTGTRIVTINVKCHKTNSKTDKKTKLSHDVIRDMFASIAKGPIAIAIVEREVNDCFADIPWWRVLLLTLAKEARYQPACTQIFITLHDACDHQYFFDHVQEVLETIKMQGLDLEPVYLSGKVCLKLGSVRN